MPVLQSVYSQYFGNTLTITAAPTLPDTQAATVQEVQDLVAYLSLYDSPEGRQGPLIVADERDGCEGGEARDGGACSAGGAR